MSFVYANQNQNNMKRLFTILLVLAVCIPAMAQKTLPKHYYDVPFKAEKDIFRTAPPAKNVFLYQGFDEFPGEGWSTVVTVPTHTWVYGPQMLNSQGQVVVGGFAGNFAYCQWQAAQIQDEWMISPSIDLSGLTLENPLVLDFYWFGHNQWSAYCDLNIKISTDGGSNWTLLWNEDDAAAGWSTFTWYYAAVNLDDYLGESDVIIGIQYTGNDGAQFGIDEIRIYEQLNNEITLASFGMANKNTGYYSHLPISHLGANSGLIYFEAPVENNGLNAQTNVKLNVEITKGEESVFTTTSTQVIGSIPSFGKDTIRIGNKDPEVGNSIFAYPQAIGTYNVNFEIVQDEDDQYPINNVKNTTFKATSRSLARFTNTVNSVGTNNYTDAQNGDFIGVTFELVQDETLESVSVYLSEGATLDNSFRIVLYQATASGWEAVPGTSSDLIDIEEGMAGTWITYTYDAPVALPAQTAGESNFYVMGIEAFFSDINTGLMGFRADRTFNHWFNVSSRLRNGGTWYFISYVPAFVANFVRPTHNLTFDVKDQDGAAIPNAVVTLNGTAHPAGQYTFTLMEDQYNYTVALGAFSTSGTIDLLSADATVPVVLNTLNVGNLNVEALKVFPNPFNNNLKVQFNAPASDNYTIRLVALNGQEILVENHAGFSGNFNREYNLGGIANGVYYLQIISGQGTSIHKVMKK